TAVQRAVLDKVLPAPLGFLALRVRAGFQVTSVPVVAIRVAQNRYSNVENFPVTAVGADSIEYEVIQWPDGRVSDGFTGYEDRTQFIESWKRARELEQATYRAEIENERKSQPKELA